jgi:hypothetical protein
MAVSAPPELIPVFVEGNFVVDSVPGLVRAPPGVSFAWEVSHEEYITMFSLHTLSSLRHEPCFPDIYKHLVIMMQALCGVDAHMDSPGATGLVDMGLQPNDRSPKDRPLGSISGSFNLAGALVQTSSGVIAPASQIRTAEFRSTAGAYLESFSTVANLVAPLVLNKFELSNIEFHSVDNNIFGFGGLGAHNPTNCQINITELYQSLEQALGFQGKIHPDPGDAKMRLTIFLLVICIPRGMYLCIEHNFSFTNLFYFIIIT